MSATVQQARNEIHALFLTAWQANVLSENLPVLYADISQRKPDSGSWCRIDVKHVEGFTATLPGDVRTRRYRRMGVTTVQIFTEFGHGQLQADRLTAIVEGAFQGQRTSPGGVIFRDVRVREIGQDGQWFQTNVLADFEYDEVK